MIRETDGLHVTSAAFVDKGTLPKRHTGFGEDVSPPLTLHNLSTDAVSVVIVMEDLDVPLQRAFPHWLLFNIPPMREIPEGIPHEPIVGELGNAVQGIAYGRNRYAGPKMPSFGRKLHHYRFTVYALDCLLDIKPSARKRMLMAALRGHVIQQAAITGTYKRESGD